MGYILLFIYCNGPLERKLFGKPFVRFDIHCWRCPQQHGRHAEAEVESMTVSCAFMSGLPEKRWTVFLWFEEGRPLTWLEEVWQ